MTLEQSSITKWEAVPTTAPTARNANVIQPVIDGAAILLSVVNLLKAEPTESVALDLANVASGLARDSQELAEKLRKRAAKP